jgi:hypothetical protein
VEESVIEIRIDADERAIIMSKSEPVQSRPFFSTLGTRQTAPVPIDTPPKHEENLPNASHWRMK